MAWNTLPYENNGYFAFDIKEFTHSILGNNNPEHSANNNISQQPVVPDWNQSTGVENPDHPKVTEYINSQPVDQQCKDSMMAAWKGWGRTKYYAEQYGERSIDELAEEFILFMSKPRSIPSIPKPFANMQAKVDDAWDSMHDGWDIVSRR